MDLYPLVVDLDGTLVHSDMLHESALRVFRDKPFDILLIPFWLIKGKAILKQNLATRTSFNPEFLPYNRELLMWLQQKRAEGRKLVLCTASDRSFAISIAKHLGIFDEIIASDGSINLSGSHKAEILEQRFGRGGFDYVGNANADLLVWERSRHAIVVNASSDLVNKAGRICKVEQEFPKKASGFTAWRRVFRLHQWLKNLLLFVPIFAAHQLTSIDIWATLTIAFFSFGFCASSVYITNDLLDLENDHQHPRKQKRPFASGRVPVWVGVAVAPILFLISSILGSYVGGSFLGWLIFYFVLTCAYSWGLKRLMLVDCLVLAMLYTLRIIAGAAVAGHTLSFWLLAFSVFLFLSLAFLKRYAELDNQLRSGKQKAHGRGYHSSDAPLIQTLGIASGYASVLVLALYLNSESVVILYQTPELVWGTVPIMLFWISWMWMQAHRGMMHDDPLVFALKDKASLLSGVLFSIVLGIGSVGWPW